MDRPLQSFSEWISNTAELLGYRTDAQLAAAIGIHQSNVTRWKQGAQRPQIDHLVKLAELLQMKVMPLLVLARYIPEEHAANSALQEPVRMQTEAERRIQDCPPSLRDLVAGYWKERQREEEDRLLELLAHLQGGDNSEDVGVMARAVTTNLPAHVGALISLAKAPRRKARRG